MNKATAIIICVILSIGCAPNVSSLRSHLKKGAYDLAWEEVRNDPKMVAHLAALILEREATEHPDSAVVMVNSLAGSGKPGKYALKRLARSTGVASRLADIALGRSSLPSDRALDSYLSDSWSDVRVAAARTWSRKIDRKRLQNMILDPDPGVRVEAAAGLGRFEGEKIARILAQTTRLDPDPRVRARAVTQVKSLGTGALDVCRSALDDENMGVRNAALRGLSDLGDDSAVELIRDRMAGPMTEVTVVAAAELSRLDHKDGKSRFLESLKNRRSNIRATALTHLDRARIENPEKIRLRMLDDQAPSVVLTAAAALLATADPKGPVAHALRRLVEEGSDRAASARDMLAVVGDKVAVTQVEEVLEQGDEDEVITTLKRVARAMMLYDSFVLLLKDDHSKVRIEAARGVLQNRR